MTISTLTPSEVSSIVPLVRAMLLEIGDKKPLNEPFFEGTWELAIGSNTGVIWVAQDERGIQGVAVAILFPSMFTGKPMAALLFEYVMPHYRGKLGIRLFKTFDKWAEEIGVETRISGINRAMPEGNVKMYRSMKYRHVEDMWTKEF